MICSHSTGAVERPECGFTTVGWFTLEAGAAKLD